MANCLRACTQTSCRPLFGLPGSWLKISFFWSRGRFPKEQATWDAWLRRPPPCLVGMTTYLPRTVKLVVDKRELWAKKEEEGGGGWGPEKEKKKPGSLRGYSFSWGKGDSLARQELWNNSQISLLCTSCSSSLSLIFHFLLLLLRVPLVCLVMDNRSHV